MTLFRAALCASLIFASGLTTAAFPDKPVRLIVPFPAGGAADVMARGLAHGLGNELGHQVIVADSVNAPAAIPSTNLFNMTFVLSVHESITASRASSASVATSP